ncbi:hypothetical protein [Bradyrhizobium ottawaense]|uniref:hypothetical protein n=1 Tax=Bradyrhizobium ottawaense TaxID=931866 RepID=UPI0012606EC5|nr:hypothetical protein [Bradyrhizobium ottawaense]
MINDLKGQVEQFKTQFGTPITIGSVGINVAQSYVSFEGPGRSYSTTGQGKHKHPYQDADEAERRLRHLAQQYFDEFLVLRFDEPILRLSLSLGSMPSV